MVDSDDYISDSDDYEAVISSLLQPNASSPVRPYRGGYDDEEVDPEDDRRLIKEVMQLSKLEDAKLKGKLSLDHLKRKNKPAEISTGA